MWGTETATHTPVQARKRPGSPCKGCRYNLNGSDAVDYADHDTEIGCSSKNMARGRKLVPIKPTEKAKTGCKFRKD